MLNTFTYSIHIMAPSNKCFTFLLLFYLGVLPNVSFGQQIKNVPKAFNALKTTPELIVLDNALDVPTAKGHFQGVQVIQQNGREKLLISGSSQNTAYILQADMTTQKTEKLIPLMRDPFRHAGGMQASAPYVSAGIEDNVVKTTSKVYLYNYETGNLAKARPTMHIDRQGEVERYTAGATGLLALKEGYLLVVGNWDSRHWDFYHVNPKTGTQQMLTTFAAPDDWAGYQSINLICDNDAIYAMGTYLKEETGFADLILVSNQGNFEPIMEKISTKAFNCTEEVDFSGAAGLQVDDLGKLHLWGTQKNAEAQIRVNRFSEP